MDFSELRRVTRENVGAYFKDLTREEMMMALANVLEEDIEGIIAAQVGEKPKKRGPKKGWKQARAKAQAQDQAA